MPLGREVDLGPGGTVLDGDSAELPLPKGHSSPNFRPCLLWPNGWMDLDAPGGTVLDGDSAELPLPKGHSSPNFRPCLLWPNGWMDLDAT